MTSNDFHNIKKMLLAQLTHFCDTIAKIVLGISALIMPQVHKYLVNNKIIAKY